MGVLQRQRTSQVAQVGPNVLKQVLTLPILFFILLLLGDKSQGTHDGLKWICESVITVFPCADTHSYNKTVLAS